MPEPPTRRGRPHHGPAAEDLAAATQLNLTVTDDTTAPDRRVRTDPDPARRRNNLEAGRKQADAGAVAARANTPVGARHEVEAALDELIATGAPFDVEDLRDATRGHVLGAHDNALGAVIRHAARQGLIVPVGVRTATRERARGHLIRVWQGVGHG